MLGLGVLDVLRVGDNAWVRSTRIEDNAWVIRGQAYEVYSLVQAREVLGMGP